MTVEEPNKKGRVAAAILAGSALTFSSFALGVPAAFADTTEPTSSPTDTASASESPSSTPPTDTASASESSSSTPAASVSKSESPSPSDESEDSKNENVQEQPEEDSPVVNQGTSESSNSLAQNDPSELPDEPPIGIGVSTSEAAPGDDMTLTGYGFTPGSDIKLVGYFEDSDQVLGTGKTTADEADEENDHSGGAFAHEFSIPEDAEAGIYRIEATDEAGRTAPTWLTIVTDEDEGDEDSQAVLEVSQDQITLEEFVGGPDNEPDVGVVITVSGLEYSTDLAPRIVGPADVAHSPIVWAGEEATFSIYGEESESDVTDYLGDYSVTVTYEDEAGETQELGPEAFSVVEDGPLVELSANQAYPGEDIHVSGRGFSVNAELEISINPTLAELTADDNGAFSAEVTIPGDLAPGHYDITVDNQNADERALQTIEILDPADQVVDPSLTIDPDRITLEDFVGDPEDGAGVAHVVDGLEPNAEITYLISGPEYVSDFESSATADDDGVAQFVIHGYDVADPVVYLGEYNTVVTYTDEDGDTAGLNGTFTVVDGEGTTGGSDDSGDSDVVGPAGPADLNGYVGLAQTGATGVHLGLLAGALLLVGGAFVAFANRARLFGRKH